MEPNVSYYPVAEFPLLDMIFLNDQREVFGIQVTFAESHSNSVHKKVIVAKLILLNLNIWIF